MNIFDKLVDFVFDEKKKISSKAVIITLAFLSLFLIDNILGFSNSYVINNKIEQVNKLNIIISNPTSDSLTKNQAIKLRKEIFYHKNIIEKTNNYISKLSFYQNQNITTQPKIQKNDTQIVGPNIFWFHVTSSGLYYFVGFLILPIMLFLDKSSSLPERIGIGAIFFLLSVGIGLLFYWLCSLIPMLLNNSWILNYAVNLLIQSLMVIISIKSGKS